MLDKCSIVYKIKNQLEFIIVIGAIIIFMSISGIGCPILYMTGIPCMGCGMTRAFMSLLKMNFVDAFTYHPLCYVVIAYIATLYFKKQIGKKRFEQ